LSDEKRDPEVLVELAVRLRRTELGEGDRTQAASVHCPIAHGSETLEHCLACPRYVGLSCVPGEQARMNCYVPRPVLEHGPEPSSLVQLMEQTPIRALMGASVTCVDSELALDEVAAVLERERLQAAPVVEDTGVLIGMVSRSDLVRGRHVAQCEGDPGSRFPPDCIGLVVDDVMSTDVPTLVETATVLEATVFFAEHGVHRVPVVTPGGEVVGVLSLIDLVRWLANAPGVGRPATPPVPRR
jgi:CBS domain-containing protein